MTMTDDGNPVITYSIYRKDAKGGEKVTLGAANMNTAVNYVVAATEYREPVTTTTTVTTVSTTIEAVTTTSATTRATAVPTQEPTTTAQMTTTSVQPTLLGDVNLDGKVTISDSVAILQYLANKDKYSLTAVARANADVYNPGDGITGNDALSIQKLDSNVITSLPESGD